MFISRDNNFSSDICSNQKTQIPNENWLRDKLKSDHKFKIATIHKSIQHKINQGVWKEVTKSKFAQADITNRSSNVEIEKDDMNRNNSNKKWRRWILTFINDSRCKIAYNLWTKRCTCEHLLIFPRKRVLKQRRN